MVQLNRALRNWLNCMSWLEADREEPEKQGPTWEKSPPPAATPTSSPRCNEAPLMIRPRASQIEELDEFLITRSGLNF